MWFFDAEDSQISEIIEKLSTTKGDDNKVTNKNSLFVSLSIYLFQFFLI